MGIHQSSFNEREHCWTDYENPSDYPRLFLELPRQTSDWQHRGAAEHRLLPIFSQLLQGSGGRTKAELENLLGVAASDSLVEQYKILGEGLAGEGFKQANLLAVADSFKPKREYRASLNNGFQSDIREFNFNSNSLGSVQEINRYVEDVTNQKIKDLLADDDVDGLTRMVLINAVYFKANWQFAFNA